LDFGLRRFNAESGGGSGRSRRAGGGWLMMDVGVSAIGAATKKNQDYDRPQPRQRNGGPAKFNDAVLGKGLVSHRSPNPPH
jgi:hypothetical protein